MVGGGIGAFIGEVHRIAARIDGQIELVCGAFSSSAERSKQSGKELYLPANRVYANFEEMILKEKELPEGERMDFVSIVTPNHLHYAPAKMALENGFHVICDKPLAFNLEEAQGLERLVEESGLIFALTHNYTGYPMVKQAREMVRSGTFGRIRKVVAEYPQGWLSTFLESTSQKQAAWRTDPKRSGASGCFGDIGSHAENLVEYITGLKITELCADLSIMVEGRLLDDDGSVLVRFDNGAKGIVYASQISAGEENELKIRVYGEKGGLEWLQSAPNVLTVKWLDAPKQIYKTGNDYLSSQAAANARIPAGHPEGYLEAFANIYRNVAKCIQARLKGKEVDEIFQDFPTVQDGVRGILFIEKVVESSKSEQKWVSL